MRPKIHAIKHARDKACVMEISAVLLRYETPTMKQLAPAYEGVELGIGDAVLQKAIQGATGRSAKDVRPGRSKDFGSGGRRGACFSSISIFVGRAVGGVPLTKRSGRLRGVTVSVWKQSYRVRRRRETGGQGECR